MFVSVITMVAVVNIIHIVNINVHVMVTTVATCGSGISLGSPSQVTVSAVLLLPILVATTHDTHNKI